MTLAELNELKAKKAAEIKEMREKIITENMIKAMNSPLYVKRLIAQEDEQVIDKHLLIIESLLIDEDKKLTKVFGYGSLVSKLLTLVKSVVKLSVENREIVYADLGITNDQVEDLLESFGNTAYYLVDQDVIVPAKGMDIVKLKELLVELSTTLGITEPSFNKLNEDTVTYFYNKAQIEAESLQLNTQKMVELQMS